jgi:hypothetical protein
VGLSHQIYAKDTNDKIQQKYIPKLFSELISDENSTLRVNHPLLPLMQIILALT